tara:strand:+ start:741 stop:1289 length:549 start_codon:yes stop_codon:yes gene_type:complete
MSTLKVNTITNISGGTDISGVGIIKSYAIIADGKSGNTDGGSFSAGDWRTRDLNHEISDTDSIVSISNNQFTLGAGKYLIKASSPACQVGGHQIRLYSVTDDAAIKNGTPEFSGQIASGAQTRSFLEMVYTISVDTTFAIQHRCSTTQSQTFGAGAASSGSVAWNSGSNTVFYTIVELYKGS